MAKNCECRQVTQVISLVITISYHLNFIETLHVLEVRKRHLKGMSCFTFPFILKLVTLIRHLLLMDQNHRYKQQNLFKYL